MIVVGSNDQDLVGEGGIGPGQQCRDVSGLHRSWLYGGPEERAVAVSRRLTPLYPSTRFSDATLFLPYAELHMARGKHQLGVTVGIFSGSKRIGSMDDLKKFSFTQR